MAKTPPAERRKFIRLDAPIGVTYTVDRGDKVYRVVSKNVSALGLRFQSFEKNLRESSLLDLTINLPEALNPVHACARVIWVKKLSLEDNAPLDIGVEFESVDEDNKNTFLKFLCDLIYNISPK
ncbi:MAG: PilZ domain-containing protein [Candidatus Omnitrophota bacterium]